MTDIVFGDSETRSLLDVTQVGAYRYAKHSSTDALCWAWVFNDETNGQIWSPPHYWGNANHTRRDTQPERLLDHASSGGLFGFWNAFFDHCIWNYVMVPLYGWPPLRIEQVRCIQAQAESNNLPGQLGKAADCLGTQHKKDKAGTRLIQQLSMGTRQSWNSATFETVDKMGHMRAYCLSDVMTTRDISAAILPLPENIWREYEASERINFRGVGVDVKFANRALAYADAEFDDINAQLAEVTGDKQITVTNHPRKALWLHENLWPAPELQEIVERPPKKVEGKEDKKRYSADRPTRELLMDLLSQPDYAHLFEPEHLDRVITMLELVEAGNSAAVRKFTAIANQAVDGRVYGGYSFNGAGQTGRFSSRGIQVHNIIRAPLEYGNPNRAIDAIEDIINGTPPKRLVEEYGFPIQRLLARLIRPTFIAGPGNMLVWGDWDQIEARALPWLSQSPGGERKLDLFRRGEDVYKHAALPIYGETDIDKIDGDMRQVGKVSELSLGYGGSVGAFAAMGRNYGVILDGTTVRRIVNTWRNQNQWCVNFWYQLWDASIAAYKNPGAWFDAGRVRYLYHPELMHGTLICALPDSRLIVYPQYRREECEYEDKNGEKRRGIRTSCVRGFGSGYGRVDLWYGQYAENVTQAISASFLRRALVELDDVAVLHTHDEVVTEVAEDQAELMALDLRDTMTELPDWAAGLPLSVTIESGPFYSK